MRPDISEWVKKLNKVLSEMPPGIEAHVGYKSISVYPRGRLKDHLASSKNGFGIENDGTEIGYIITDGRLIPYSEDS